ncbi:MAG: hypothetical protein NT121_23670 [Chloroflexi bacterium]|nr:hypothetical protein [Chloroflexota bacterium]
MTRRQLQLLGLAALSTLVIAILLRDVVEQFLIRPAAYFFWLLGVLYRFIPQPIVWLLLVLAMLYLTLGNFAGKFEWPRWRKQKISLARGPLEELAAQIDRKNDGIYFKWQIARTLGDMAMDAQELRQHTRRKLEMDGPLASPNVRRYLDSALNSSFSDYPLSGGIPLPRRFQPLPPTPFDIELGPVIDYLESQMENDDDLRRP